MAEFIEDVKTSRWNESRNKIATRWIRAARTNDSGKFKVSARVSALAWKTAGMTDFSTDPALVRRPT
jgi:hypothetical protein